MLRYLLKGIGATGHAGEDLLSYLAFEPIYVQRVMELGYADTMARRDEIAEFLLRAAAGAGAGAARQRRRGAARASLEPRREHRRDACATRSRASTTAPPAMAQRPGALARDEEGPDRVQHRLEQDEERRLDRRRPGDAAREAEVGEAELEDPEVDDEGEVAPASRAGPRDQSGSVTAAARTFPQTSAAGPSSRRSREPEDGEREGDARRRARRGSRRPGPAASSSRKKRPSPTP